MAGNGLSARQSLFVAGLALGKGQAESARFASVSARTGRRWYSLPVVRGALREQQGEVMARAARLAANMAAGSLATLWAIRDDDLAPVAARVQACRAILDNARALHTDFELGERIAELERIVRQSEHT
jgi:hypothetical protein